MAAFVRVELHRSAASGKYHELHQFMANAGFKRTVTATDGKKYRLPSGSYVYEGASSATQVRDLAHSAAHRTGCVDSIFVADSNIWAWSGLEQAQFSASEILAGA